MDTPSREKKPYVAPTVTEHGNAVKQTLGMTGKYWEPLIYQNWPVIEEE
jgi:hypothetical protein